MTNRTRFLTLGILFGAAFTAAAQHRDSAGKEKPVVLEPGLGTWRHPIATGNPEAQKFFDQGLILMYGFNRYEALRSFRKAVELDPQAAMAYWGIAMSLGPYINMDLDPEVNIKESCDAVAAGLRVAAAPADRAWLEAAGARCPDFSKPADYIRAMRELAAKLPDDADAQTLYADALLLPSRWKWYTNDGQPAEGVLEAERVLEQVLRRHPDHPGANHLLIHAAESSPTPELAVPSAQRLMGIVPSAGHIVHMPGHIWLALGDYENTVAVNERAVEVDREYFARTGVKSGYGMYYLHNLQFIVYTRGMQGRAAETRKAAADFSEAVAEVVGAMPEMADLFQLWLAFAKLRAGLWDDVLSARQPEPAPASLAAWHAARALAFAGKGQLVQSKAEQADLETVRKNLDTQLLWGNNRLSDVMELASAVIAARVAPSPAESLPSWKRAVDLADALVYDEPPGWYYPVRESLGAALLLAGHAEEAEATFREGLRRSPRNGRMLFGLFESLKAQKKTEAARWVEQEFDRAWAGADINLKLEDL